MANTRQKNAEWIVTDHGSDKVSSWEQVQVAVLMDLRDELQEANRLHRELRQSINTIRHFFHQPNMATGVAEVLRREAVKAKRHAAKVKAARAKARAARKAAA